MNKKYSWQRTEEAELDLEDLLRRLGRQWKRIAVCAFVFAVVIGGYGFLRDRSSPDEMTESEKQAVISAVLLKNETKGLETYLDNSVLMQLDPYQMARYTMLYRIDHVKVQELPAVMESFLNFILSGGAADALAESGSWQLDKSYLAELITAYQKTYSFPYLINADEQTDSRMTDSLFYVEVTGKNAGEAEKMALDIQRILKKYAAAVSETAGSHRLELVSSMESITADSGLQTQQHDKKALLSSNKVSLKAMKDAFSKEQMAAYQEAAGIEEGEQEAVLDKTSGYGVKYGFLGLIGGIFVYCCFFACCYLFSDKVKSIEELKRMYAFSVYGGIAPDNPKDQMMNRIRLACQKQGIKRLCAAADFTLNMQERECLKSIAKELKGQGIEMTVAENAVADTAVWDSLTETGKILMVCRIGTTTHHMIDDAMEFYTDNGIAVAGAAAFMQNK